MGVRRWLAGLLRAARIRAGRAAAAFGVVIFVPPGPAAMGSAGVTSESLMLTLFSVIMMAGGVVIMVGVKRVNEMAGRNRRTSR